MRTAGLERFVSTYFLLSLVFLPFPWRGLSLWSEFVHWLWGPPTAALAEWWTGSVSPLGLSSDSPQLIAWLVLLIPLALLIILAFRSKLERVPWLGVLSFFLSLIFLRYGLDKLSGGQFPAPDLFVLDTKFGELDNDLLYWSVMGQARGYQWFLGLAEIIPALGLLWPKTRRWSLILLLPVTLNVVAVNWGFDISVKVLSSLLLGVNGWCLFVDLRGSETSLAGAVRAGKRPHWLLLVLIAWACIYPYAQRGYFYASAAPVASFHGIYRPLRIGGPWARLIVLRDDYWLLDEVDGKRYRWHRADLPFAPVRRGDTLWVNEVAFLEE